MLSQSKRLALLAILFLAIYQLPTSFADDINCYECDSSDDNCIKDLSKITTKACESNICYTKIDTTSGKVTRGCQPMEATTTTTLKPPNAAAEAVNVADQAAETECKEPDCYSCTIDKCNKNNVCKSCNSSTNSTCAQTDSTNAAFNSLCKGDDTAKCLITVNDQMHLERRCATDDDISKCTNADTCSTCTGGNCNTGIFPKNRKRCYQCSSTETTCSNVVTNSLNPLPCLLYKADDKCFTYGTDETHMTRGCVSDTNTDVNKCTAPESNELCLTCDVDNCNNYPYNRDQVLKCVQCQSSKEDVKCMWGQSANDAKNCVNKIVYNKQESCYTQTKDDLVYRGCYYDRDATALGECKTENGCETCNTGDGCNNKDAASFTCIRCRSDIDTNCRDQADKITGTECRNPVTEATSKCFHGIWNNVVIRGCLLDANEQMQYVCNDKDTKQCITCDGKDCNNNKTSGSATLRLTTGLLAIILMTLWYLH